MKRFKTFLIEKKSHSEKVSTKETDADDNSAMQDEMGSGFGSADDESNDEEDIEESKKYPLANKNDWYGDANYEQTGGKIIHMSPDDFLSKARPMKIDDTARENIDDLKNHISSGKSLDPLALYSNGKEDGRHRAHASKELGIKKIPVLTWDKK